MTRPWCFCGDETGSSAIEFALIAPVFLLLVFGVFGACEITATLNDLEQIAAGAARSTVAGLSDTERAQLAKTFVSANAPAYPYLNANSLSVATSGNSSARTFTVTLSYDASKNGVLTTARSILPGLPSTFTRSSVAIEGGS